MFCSPASVVSKDEAARHGQRLASGLRSDEGITVAVAADPGTKADELGQFSEGRFGAIFDCQRVGDFGIENRQRVEDGGLVVVEGHADLVAYGRTALTDFVGLPQRGDLGDDVLFEGFELRVGNGNTVELFQQVGDAAAFKHDDAAGDLGWMGSEDRGDADAFQQGAGLISRDTSETKLPQCSTQRPALRFGVGVKLAGKAAALTVVGFGQVNEFEVEGKGTGKLVRGGFGESPDAAQSMLQRVCCGRYAWLRAGSACRSGRINFTPLNRGLAQLLDGLEDWRAGLLAENFAEQHAERTDVAAQRSFLELAGGRLKFGQALRPVGRRPE